MKLFLACIVFLFSSHLVYSQDDFTDKYFAENDSLYREDQFYLSFGINFLLDLPSGVNQSGFSGGVNFGFIRDMPVNKQRNIALGIGLGLSLDTYSQNLFIGEDTEGNTVFEVLDNDFEYSTNRFATQVVEMPIHFRWRTSQIGDASSFWRIYTGFNLGYLYYFKSRFEQEQNTVIQTDLDELNRLRYSFYFAFGKSKINFFFKYSLNPLFDGTLIDRSDNITINEIKAGLVFYIL